MESSINSTSSLGNAFVWALAAAVVSNAFVCALIAALVAFRFFNGHHKPDGEVAKDADERHVLERTSHQLQQPSRCRSLADVTGAEPCAAGASGCRPEEEGQLIKRDDRDKQYMAVLSDEYEKTDPHAAGTPLRR